MRFLLIALALFIFPGLLCALPPSPVLPSLSCAQKDIIDYGLVRSSFSVFQCCEWDGGECGCSNGTVVCCDGELSFCPCSDLDS